jgi:hypothetical protein
MSELDPENEPSLNQDELDAERLLGEGGVMPEIMATRRIAHVPEQALPILGELTTLSGRRVPSINPDTDAYQLDRFADDGAPPIETF